MHYVHTKIVASFEKVFHEIAETRDSGLRRPFTWELKISGSAEVEVLLMGASILVRRPALGGQVNLLFHPLNPEAPPHPYPAY